MKKPSIESMLYEFSKRLSEEGERLVKMDAMASAVAVQSVRAALLEALNEHAERL